MKIEIKNRYDGSVIYTGEFETLLLAVEEAVKKGANLVGAIRGRLDRSWSVLRLTRSIACGTGSTCHFQPI